MAGLNMIKACFISLVCEAFLHGIYTILCSAVFYLLLHKPRIRRTSSANILMTTVTAIMYLSATVHLVLSFYVNWVAIFEQHGAEGDGLHTDINNFRDPKLYSQIALEVVNYVIGDSVVVWRTWVIWGRNYHIIILPVICGVGGIAAAIGLVRSFAHIPPGEAIYNSDVLNWFLSFGALTCAINIYAVAAISYKTWESVRLRRSLGNMTIGGASCYGVLLILIESGMVYCLILVITVILMSIQSGGVYIITDMLGQLTGIYPTVIIVLVCLKMTWEDNMLSVILPTSTLQYARQPVTSVGSDTSEISHTTGLHSRLYGNRSMDDSDSTHNTSSTIKIQTVTLQQVWHDQPNEEVIHIKSITNPS